MIGKVLKDRYEIIKPIGFGGMADVYLAQDRLLERLVAVKVLRSEFLENAQQVQQFQREALAAAALHHPSIINIYDVAKQDDLYYIVMEYVNGVTLKKFVELKGKLPVAMAVDLARQLAGALAEAHQHRVVHCDIKPQNILLDSQGVPKIVDFGISKMVSGETKVYTSSLVGSVHYISPEQAKGSPVTAQSDIYSLGVVFYEMLTGKVPFDGGTPVTIAMKHLNDQPAPLGEVLADVPDALQEVLDKALAKEPAERYQTAADMQHDLMMLWADLRRMDEDMDITAPLATLTAEEVARAQAEEQRQRRVQEALNPETTAVNAVAGAGAAAYAGTDALEHTLPDLTGTVTADGGTTIAMQRPPELETDDPDETRNLAGVALAAAAAGAVVASAPAGATEVTPPEDVATPNPDRREKLEDFPEHKYPEGPRPKTPEEKEQRKKALHKFICIALLTAIAVVLGIGSYFWYSAPTIEVPNVVGLTVVEAQKKLEEQGFRVKLEEVVAEDVTPGTVVAQKPEGKTKRKEGSRIRLDISKGLDLGEVPSVVGLTYEEAKQQLLDAGYELGSLSRAYVKEKPVKTVLRQLPTGKSRLPKGSQIDLVINMEPPKDLDKVELPDVVGMKLSDAQDMLVRMGLSISEVKEVNSDKPQGEVLSMDPPAKDKADKETKITMTVSTGKQDGQVDGSKYVPGTGPATQGTGKQVVPGTAPASQSGSTASGGNKAGNAENAGTTTPTKPATPVTPTGNKTKPASSRVVRYAEFTVPGKGDHQVRIVARDDEHSWTVFNGKQPGGSIIRQRVEGKGSLRAIFYVDGQAAGGQSL